MRAGVCQPDEEVAIVVRRRIGMRSTLSSALRRTRAIEVGVRPRRPGARSCRAGRPIGPAPSRTREVTQASAGSSASAAAARCTKSGSSTAPAGRTSTRSADVWPRPAAQAPSLPLPAPDSTRPALARASAGPGPGSRPTPHDEHGVTATSRCAVEREERRERVPAAGLAGNERVDRAGAATRGREEAVRCLSAPRALRTTSSGRSPRPPLSNTARGRPSAIMAASVAARGEHLAQRGGQVLGRRGRGPASPTRRRARRPRSLPTGVAITGRLHAERLAHDVRARLPARRHDHRVVLGDERGHLGVRDLVREARFAGRRPRAPRRAPASSCRPGRSWCRAPTTVSVRSASGSERTAAISSAMPLRP